MSINSQNERPPFSLENRCSCSRLTWLAGNVFKCGNVSLISFPPVCALNKHHGAHCTALRKPRETCAFAHAYSNCLNASRPGRSEACNSW